MSRVLMKFGVTCHTWMENGRFSMSFAENGRFSMSFAENGRFLMSFAENGRFSMSFAENGRFSMSVAENGRFFMSVAENGRFSMSFAGKRKILHECRGERKILHEFRGKRKILHECRGKKRLEETFLYKSIHVEFFCRGNQCLWFLTAIRFIFYPPPTKQKSTSSSEWTKFSSHFSKKDILCLFGKDAISAVLHHDSSRAHAAATTVQWLENFGYNFIPLRDWPTNSPNLSPMDYSVNGISSADFGNGRHAAWRDWKQFFKTFFLIFKNSQN